MKVFVENIIHRCIDLLLMGLVISFMFNLVACGRSSYTYQVPEMVKDGWETTSLEKAGISETYITEKMNYLLALENNPIHSMIIVKDGKLVLEEYFPGQDLRIEGGLHLEQKDFDRNTLHCLASASKSITSILLGIAIDQGYIPGPQSKLFSFFPEYPECNDAEKALIDLRHLLTMSSGIPWDESYPYDDLRNDLAQMLREQDPVGYVLSKPLAAKPGESFIYNSGTTNLIGEIIRKATGSNLADYAREYLFDPLGITSFEWVSFPDAPEKTVASSLLYLHPRDMAKIGQLYLQNGIWNGNRIVSEKWVAESTRNSMNVSSGQVVIPEFNTGYGYQWWQGTFTTGNVDTYYAAGYGGQFIFILPELNMVIVFTAGQYEGGYEGFISLVNEGILQALN